MQLVQIQEVRLNRRPANERSIKWALKHAINSLYERLRDERIDFASVAQVYLRLDPFINWGNCSADLKSSSLALRKLARSRFPKANTFLLFCADFQHVLIDMSWVVPPNDNALMDDLKDEELQKIMSESGALYEGNRHHVFRLPSGSTADFFLRTGNCLARPKSLLIFAFWALPHLKGRNLIVCDTWSISTLGFFLARLAERYSGEEYDCQYFSKYLDEDIESFNEVAEFLEQVDDGQASPLFLVSAISSGRSLRLYLDTYSDLFGDEKASVLGIFLVGGPIPEDLRAKANIGVLCSLARELEARGLQGLVKDTELREGQQIFVVDPKTYFPRYFEPREHKFRVAFASHSKPFFERYAGYGVFSVCRDGSSNRKMNLRRHHAFHIDVGKLIGTVEFKEKLKQLLDGLVRLPTHLVHLSKPADQELAELIRDIISSTRLVGISRTSSFRKIKERQDILTRLNDPDASVWFVDAMYISGQSTAQDFEQGLREGLGISELTRYEASISYFVGVLRPDLSAKVTSDNRTMIRLSCPTRDGQIGVHAVETVLLPNWNERDCPWCAEKRLHSLLLSKHAKEGMSGQERDYIEKRIALLTEGRRDGLKSQLFFKRYPQHSFHFNVGGLWFDVSHVRSKGLQTSEADVVLAIASALQYWRDDYGSFQPAHYLLDQQTCFGVNVYNETLLRAAIWRSLKRREVDTFLGDKYVGDLLNRVFDKGGGEDSTDEFVLGWEASMLLGRYLPRILGSEKFEQIDWAYLKWTALAT